MLFAFKVIIGNLVVLLGVVGGWWLGNQIDWPVAGAILGCYLTMFVLINAHKFNDTNSN